jgi:UDP-N-acetyl-D-mannosaminuronate dehydrogenase
MTKIINSKLRPLQELAGSWARVAVLVLVVVKSTVVPTTTDKVVIPLLAILEEESG